MTQEAPRNSHLSFSRLSRLETCPLSYRFHYLDKFRAEPGVALMFGKAILAALENLFRKVLKDDADKTNSPRFWAKEVA